MADKKSWRDYSQSKKTEGSAAGSTGSKKTGSWKDYSMLESGSGSGRSNDWRSYSSLNTTSIVGDNIVNRVNSWLKNHNSYISDYQKRYSSRKGNYEDAYVSDSAEWLNNARQRKATLNEEADAILSYMDQYKGYLDEKWMKEIRQSILSAKGTQGQILYAASNDNKYWSSFGTEEMVKEYGSAEDAYKAHQLVGANTGKTTAELDEVLAGMEDSKAKELLTSYRSTVERDEMGKFDLVAGAKEIEELERVADEMATISNQYYFATNSSMYSEQEASEIISKYNALVSKYGTPEEFHANLNKKKQYLEKAKGVQELNNLTGFADPTSELYDPEFSKYAEIGAAIENPTFKDAYGTWIGPWQLGGDDIGNIVTFTRDNYSDIMSSTEGGKYKTVGNPLYNYMEEDEVKLYNYLLAKEKEIGDEYKGKASSYLSYLEPILKERMGKSAASQLTSIDIPGLEDLAVISSGLAGGVEQWINNTGSYFTGEKADPSVLQHTNAALSESLDGIGYYAHQAATTVGNMAPSILAGYALGPVAGAATMSVSAAGGAYADALAKGYDKKSARIYGNLVGASEGTLQYLIGGIGALGGVSSKIAGGTAKLASKVAAIDNSLLRVAAKLGLKGLNLGLNIGSEIIEEELQNYLEPAFRTILFGEEYDAPTMDELIETAIVTALSTGALEGISTSIEVNKQVNDERTLNNDAFKKYGEQTDTLINQGLQNDVDSKSYQLATKYHQKVQGKDGKNGKALTGQQIRNLLAANQDAITDKDMQKIQQAAEKRLTELGQTGDVAEIAKLATKYATGNELTRAEKKLLANSEYGSRVASELLPNHVLSDLQSSEWARDIGTESVNKLAYNINAIVEQMANMDKPATYKSLEERVGEEEKFNVSKTGNATIRATNEAIDLSKPEIVDFITDKETGKVTDMVLKADGKEVKASEIDFADTDQSYLYSAVKNIENITPGDATVFVRDYDPSSGLSVGEYLNGVDEAYTYGYHNYSEADMGAGQFAPKLSSEKAKGAYELGKITRTKSDADADAPVVRMRTALEAQVTAEQRQAKQKARIESGDENVYFMDGKKVVKFDEHTGKYDDKRMAGVNTAKFLAKLGIGGKYYFYESYVKDGVRVYKDANGNEVEAPNGLYKDSDGSIYIDLNAGDYGQGTTLYTLGHELLHFVKAQSKKQFKILCELVEEAYSKSDMSIHERVLAKQKFLSDKRGEPVDYTEAYEEVVADAMSTMLSDGTFHEKLMEIKVKDKDLFNTIKRFFEKLIAKFTKVYEKLTPDQQDAQDIRAMKDMFDKIQTAFAEALVEASDNFHAMEAQKNTTEDGGVKYQARENTDIPYILHRKLLNKKSIKATKKDWAKVSDARVTEYRGLSDNEIPDIDFLEIAEYNIVDKGYVYTIRNYDKDSFEIIGKNRIKNRYDGYVMEVSNNGKTGQGNSIRDAEKGSDSGGYTDSNRVSGHQGTLPENVGRSKESKDLEPSDSAKSGNTNNGQRTVNDSAQVKLSERDSKGNQLSKEQHEYFKDSKAVNENGNLKVVYHGTRNADFTVFKQNATYFTDNKEMADSYSPNGDMYEGYVNITKPYEIDAKGEKWSKIPVDEVTRRFLQESGSSVFKEDGKWRTSPADIVAAIEEAIDNGDMDYDGIIIKNIDDTGSYYKDKSSHLATDYIVFKSNQFKNVNNKAPTSDPDIRYSERNAETDKADIHSRIFDMNSEVGKLRRSIEEFEKSAEFKSAQDRLSEAIQNDNIEEGIKQYHQWRESSGYAALVDKKDALQVELDKLIKERDNIFANEGAEAEKAAIAKSGLSEADYFRKQAVKEFGYTPYFYDAGYITPNGKMLNFSGEKGRHFGSRGQDHRAIGIIYENTQGSEAMIRFMNDGNIRIMAETPGLDISSSVEPTNEQYALIRKFARENGSKERYFAVDISDENGRVIGNYEYDGYVNADRVVNDIKYFFENGKVREQSSVAQFHWSERNNAPIFYSQMGKVVESMKQDKFGASSVISMLRGRGVKVEEIRWSGIQAFLDGKKSVTKAELLDFVNSSMLHIEEEFRGGDALKEFVDEWRRIMDYNASAEDFNVDENFLDEAEEYLQSSVDEGDIEQDEMDHLMELAKKAKDGGKPSKWDDYKLDGGSNYRELVFKMPGTDYSNQMMRVHWGEDTEGVLAHTRIQDFDVNGKRMLFVEEIQSDWHNEGHKQGYATKGVDDPATVADRQLDALIKSIDTSSNLSTIVDKLIPGVIETNKRFGIEIDDETAHQYATNAILYHHGDAKEFAQIKGIELSVNEMAAFDDFHKEMDSIQREQTAIKTGSRKFVPDAPFKDNYHEYVLKRLLRMAAEEGYDSIGWTTADIQSLRWSDEFAEGYRIEYDQDIPKFLKKYGKQWGADVGKTQIDTGNGFIDVEYEDTIIEVWSMDITDSMKKSVLEEGQAMYSERGEGSSNRDLLANAFEGITQDSIEYKMIQDYKNMIKVLNKLDKDLADINAEIRKIRFGTEGARDMEALRKLEEKANRIARDINKHDKTLLSLEASEPLRKVIERERKKEARKTKDHVKELLQNKKARAEQAEYRHKIQNFKKKLEAKLLRPTDRQYVPVNLIKAMVEVCDLIDTDTDLYKADGSINKAQVKRDETKEKLSQLKDEYEKLKDHADPMYSGEFDDMVYTYLKELRDKFSEKSLKEMSVDELAEMYEILRGIDETLADARKLIGWGDAESVYEAGDSIVAEQNAITQKRKNGKRNAAQKGIDKIDNLGLSPVRNVERMSGYNQDSALLKLFKKFEQGIRKKNFFVMNAYKSFEKLTSGKEYDDAVYKEVGGKKYTDVNGRKFGLSKMQMMQAILSYERETANKMSHIEGSGFSFADLDMLKKGKLRDAISEEYSHRVPAAIGMVAEFQEILKDDKWCQDYMAAARKFFNETAKNAINETSIVLKHRIIAKDKNYIPFEVDKNFVVREISAENDIQQTINSYGMMKDIKKGASQPLIITGLNNILDRHIDQVGNVYGLAIEVRNFNKVWNVRSKDDAGNNPTVKTAVQRNWGVDGVKHIEQAVQDIQGPRSRERSALYDKVKSNYIGATFLLNLSVVTKQIGSLFSSTSMLKWRDPARMISNLLYTMANHKNISAEVDKYTATAWMRRQGMSDAELYTLMTQAKKPGLFRLMDKLPAVFNPTKWITAMDHAVALSLWRYAKQDTAKRTGFKGEELLKATAEFYDEVVENTQSMTDVLHRPEIQKKGDIMSEAFAMFKTDLYQMSGQLQATYGRYMANKSKENGKALGRTVYSIAMGAIWGQLMTTVFALLRYKVDRYKDDEDDDGEEELTVESWLKRQGFGLAGDLMGYIFPIFGSETVGIFESIMYGESDDFMDNISFTAINDLVDTMIAVGTAIKDGELPDTAKMRKYAAKALQVFTPIPANNILRTLDAIQLHAEDIANGEFLSFNAGADSKTDNLYEAIVSGDKALQAKLKSTYVDKKGNFDQSKYDTAVRKALRENDPRIHEAAQARYDGNMEEYKRIFREIQNEGKFSFDDIMSAVNSEVSAIKKDVEPKKATSDYTATGYVEAIAMGNSTEAQAMRDDIIATKVANGKTQEEAEKEFASSVATGIRDAYSSGLLDEAQAEKMLVEYAGKDEEEATSKVNYWAFCEEHSEYKDVLSESNVNDYQEFAEPADIPLDVFVQYVEGTKGLETIKDEWGDTEVTKREQVLEVIDSLPLTWQQKDALYLAAGYSESKIWDVPW